jgi:hypothetical protein
MPELFVIKTPDFEMNAWCKNVDKSRSQLSKTMAGRGLEQPVTTVFFSPAVYMDASEVPLGRYSCQQAVFFENKLYDIEFIFDDEVQHGFGDHVPAVLHPLQAVEDSFRYRPKTGSLRATINTGNDIGWFRFDIEYSLNGKLKKQNIAFEVMPTKMDMATDLEQINSALDATYPLWRFSLAEKTQHGHSAVRQPRKEFLLLWLAQFKSLWSHFEHGLRHITHAPHSRLIEVNKTLKIHQLEGQLGPRLERDVKEAINSRSLDKRFKVKKKKLTIDTVENRFIKHVIHRCMDKLQLISDKAKTLDGETAGQRLSGSFYSGLSDRRHALLKTSRHSMFLEVGDFSGLARESLVLQQKPGYAKVYRAWQQLRWYLDVLGDDASLSVRNIAELYEVWCFLQIHDILLKLGFKQVANNKRRLVDNGLRVDMDDGLAGSFDFSREDGIKLKLTHEPRFHEGTDPIRTWRTTQKPDIVLSAVFTDGREHMWVFDAKYRIEADDRGDSDLVPDDAINQMHRYRDALIHLDTSAAIKAGKSRPVFGAYVLYPGFYDQLQKNNPYQEAIEEVGIGAFSLLPSENNDGSHWLHQFLESKLGEPEEASPRSQTDNHFIEEPARIPYRGTGVSLYKDLTIVFSGHVPRRTEHYLQYQRDGKLEYYHTRLIATDRQQIERHVINEVRYLSVATPDGDNNEMQSLRHVYPVSKVELIKRSKLTEEKTGTSGMTNPNEHYWLFTLGKSIDLSGPLQKPTPVHFEVLLTDLDKLRTERDWSSLPQRYPLLTN